MEKNLFTAKAQTPPWMAVLDNVGNILSRTQSGCMPVRVAVESLDELTIGTVAQNACKTFAPFAPLR
jgi:hypothetical protein